MIGRQRLNTDSLRFVVLCVACGKVVHRGSSTEAMTTGKVSEEVKQRVGVSTARIGTCYRARRTTTHNTLLVTTLII
jgi:hypothetical protein